MAKVCSRKEKSKKSNLKLQIYSLILSFCSFFDFLFIEIIYVVLLVLTNLNRLTQGHMARLAALAATRMDESLLHFYHTEWERFSTVLRLVNHIFEYLNRHWIKRQLEEPTPRAGVYPVKVLAVVVWREEFFAAQEQRLTRALLALIEKER